MADDLETELAETLAAVTADLDAQRHPMDKRAGELCQGLEAVATAAYDELRDVTRVPAEAFDALSASLDVPDAAPGLATAARRAQRDARIAPASDTPEDAVPTDVQAPMSQTAAAKATGSAEDERQLMCDTALMVGIEHSRQHPEELRCRDRSGAPRAE